MRNTKRLGDRKSEMIVLTSVRNLMLGVFWPELREEVSEEYSERRKVGKSEGLKEPSIV